MGTAACAQIEYGEKANTEALKALTPTVTDKDGVQRALGAPRGHGVARFSQDLIPRDLWFYEYVKSDGRTVDLKILIVLFKEEIYDGHFWFSSAEILEPLE